MHRVSYAIISFAFFAFNAAAVFVDSHLDAGRAFERGLRRLLRSIGSARDTVTRPLAIGLTTFGLVGVLVGTVPGALTLGDAASGGSDPVTTMAGEGAGQTPPSDAAAPADGRAGARSAADRRGRWPSP